MEEIFLGLGGNIGDVINTLKSVNRSIASLPGVCDFSSSRLYQTSPISSIPQNDYVNTVVRIRSSLHPLALFKELEKIESNHGKTKKKKEEPRPIDIDILLYGELYLESSVLTIPHPNLFERLFVMVPLLDLTERLNVPKLGITDLRSKIETLKAISHDKVELLYNGGK